jgi:hypothetical protein
VNTYDHVPDARRFRPTASPHRLDAHELSGTVDALLPVSRVTAALDPIDIAFAQEGGYGLDWIKKFTVTEKEMQTIANPNWVWPHLIPQGHIVAFVGEPGVGNDDCLLDCQQSRR